MNFSAMTLFDLDRTLLRVNSSFAFGQYLYQQKNIACSSMLYLAVTYLFHKAGALSMASLHHRVFDSFFKGASSLVILPLARAFVKERIPAMLYLPVVKRLLKARQEGHFIAILSSSPSFLVELIAKSLDAGYWDATHYSIDKNQNFSSISRLVQGREKVDYAAFCAQQMGIGKKAITAYTDSFLDLALLQFAGKQVAVNPDRKLRAFCNRQKWEII